MAFFADYEVGDQVKLTRNIGEGIKGDTGEVMELRDDGSGLEYDCVFKNTDGHSYSLSDLTEEDLESAEEDCGDHNWVTETWRDSEETYTICSKCGQSKPIESPLIAENKLLKETVSQLELWVSMATSYAIDETVNLTLCGGGYLITVPAQGGGFNYLSKESEWFYRPTDETYFATKEEGYAAYLRWKDLAHSTAKSE